MDEPAQPRVDARQTMRLKILLPTHVLVDASVVKIIAEAENGSFCLLTRHIDFVSALVPSVLTYTESDGTEHYVGHDEGVLVKCASDVAVSTPRAMLGDDLAALRATVSQEIRRRQEHDRIVRSALARLEASVVRRFIELEQRSR